MHDLIVDVGNKQSDSALLRFAFSLARQHNAGITGLQVVALDALALALPEALSFLDEEARQAWERRDWWLTLCEQHGVRGSWEVARGFYQSVMARQAVLTDLVIGSFDNHHALSSAAVGLLGRSVLAEAVPMLLVPEQWEGAGRVRRIVIAWNGSVEAARAVRASYPLLGRAAEILVIDGEPREGDAGNHESVPAARLPLRDWLKHRNIRARWRTCADGDPVGHAIHQWALEDEADLIVMGAWGHLRVGEWLLGGVTSHMLSHSQIPLLLAH
jgi:nucleotide-binding universal stress UspA family protein